VLFDDGLFEARVDRVNNGLAMLQMIRISAAKPVLKPEKGINFPDSAIDIPSLTVEDRAHLPFVLKHADIVGYSFVRTPGDVQILEQFINERKATVPAPYLVIKIETPEAVKNLPALLLQGMKQTAFGVMIARGDLAVEIGFERMSEIQEEILWICEAAHVPVIWATQVLETLNKSGLATRSEVTDAAHAAMAECVMVNKGAHTVRVIETLKDILLRSGGHHFKKTYSMRPLSIATRFMAE
jgi:pyruvate kinase